MPSVSNVTKVRLRGCVSPNAGHGRPKRSTTTGSRHRRRSGRCEVCDGSELRDNFPDDQPTGAAPSGFLNVVEPACKSQSVRWALELQEHAWKPRSQPVSLCLLDRRLVPCLARSPRSAGWHSLHPSASAYGGETARTDGSAVMTYTTSVYPSCSTSRYTRKPAFSSTRHEAALVERTDP